MLNSLEILFIICKTLKIKRASETLLSAGTAITVNICEKMQKMFLILG